MLVGMVLVVMYIYFVDTLCVHININCCNLYRIELIV